MKRFTRLLRRGSQADDNTLLYLKQHYSAIDLELLQSSEMGSKLASNVMPSKGCSSNPYGFEIGHSDYLFTPFKNPLKSRFFTLRLSAYSTPSISSWVCECFSGEEKLGTAISLPKSSENLYETIAEIPVGTTIVRISPSDKQLPSEGSNLQMLVKTIFCAPFSFEIKALDMALAAKEDCDETNARHRAVICFPVIDWEYRNQRPHHLLRQLATQGDHIIYLSTRLFGFHDDKAIFENVEDRITKVTLPGNYRLNLYKNSPTPRSVDFGVKALMNFLLERAFEDVVLLVHLPFWLPYANRLREERGYPIIYDCMDDHAGFENNSQEMLKAEEGLCAQSDLLITTSQKLYEEKSRQHNNCCLIRNAGDPDHFSNLPSLEDSPLSHIKGPIIGYFGAIAEWFDCASIAQAAQNNPDLQFVLIGHCEDSAKAGLPTIDNLHLLGELPYKELPKYLTAFDICLIPFKRIPLTEATNPVKLYEYFASGKPVVSRSLPEVELFSGQTYLYNSTDEFELRIREALSESASDKRREMRKEIASLNTWGVRAKELRTQIDALQKKISVIVLSYEAFPFLRECVASILKNTSYLNYELIIVDNNSGAPVQNYLAELQKASPRVRLIQNQDNKGFAAGNNQGIALAKDSDTFILLNNDTVVPSGTLERLSYYAHRPELGLVGPVTNCIGNEAQIHTTYSSIEEMIRVSWGIRNHFQGESFDIKVLAMFCLAFRKEVLDKVGYLDESFGIGMFEDDDYAERARAKGYLVRCVEDVFVHHYGSVSFRQLPKETYRKIFDDNKEAYEKKWGSWIPHVAR